MKGKSNFGYKLVLFIALAAAIAQAAARDYRVPFDNDDPDPQTDSPAKASKPADTAHQLKFPIKDETGNPATDQGNNAMNLQDPSNIQHSVEYDPDSNKYYFYDKMGDELLRTPATMTPDEYMQYKSQQDEQDYWQRRLDALTLFNKKPELPQMYKEGIFDRIFGGNTISVKPQGNVDVTFGGNWQDIKNPALVQRAQKYGIFNFDMNMNINLLATVGDKLKFNISQNTKASFDYQNVQKLDYTGKEDEIIKKVEAGNISFPLKSNLISGVQSLFGIKTQLQFGKLWVTAVLSQQKSQRKSLTIQGGAQSQQIAIKADNYEENKDFLLSQYFYDNYDSALRNFPVIASLVTINKIEVWVTNKSGAVTGVRNVMCFQDLGEGHPYQTSMANPAAMLRNNLPDNSVNRLYSSLQQNPNGRLQQYANNNAAVLGDSLGRDYEITTARQLNSSEFSYNAQLGYISLNTTLNPDDVLGVAFRYTYNGKVYQVGEFAEDLPPDTTNSRVIYLKLLKGVSARPDLPRWKLMMKNVYALGGFGIQKDNFVLNIMYQNPGGGETRYLPEGPNAGVPLLTLLNLDRLNSQNQPSPDGVFDFVDGITVNTQQGKIIFPTLEPFGSDLAPSLGNNPQLKTKYLYTQLYDSTKTIAQENQTQDRYILRGSYKSSSSSDIFLGGFNIPPGSVVVTAGGQKLTENVDYQIDYNLGRLKILNTGILNSGVPINVQYEDNSTFGFTQQNFTGARLDYYVNKHLTIGATAMHMTMRPYTQKVTFGDDPISNTVLGADANFQSEFPALTRALDKLPIYSTTSPSFINASGEVASLLPGHPKQINALDKEGSSYIDDFEGATSAYDIKLPVTSWSLASTPVDARDKYGNILFPEATVGDQLISGTNRARLAWYFIEPSLVDPATGIPSYVKNDPNQHYIRIVQQTDVFPQGSTTTLQTALSTLDLGYYPRERGPYNFDQNLTDSGYLKNPQVRWGGIQRPIDNTDFEQSNVEYIQFWLMDPYLNNKTSQGGSLYFNLGDISEDVLKDSRMFFENGIPYPFDSTQLDTTAWGYVPKFEQQITRAFNNDPNARTVQDVGYDGLNDQQEYAHFQNYLQGIKTKVNPRVYQQILGDPANDDYHFYEGSDYDSANLSVLQRYKKYNSPQGNSPITSASAAYSSAATTLPESEDINLDNTLNEAENYYEYRVDIKPNMQVGTNFIVNKQISTVQLPNGAYDQETWYQFKIPIQSYTQKVGNIADFRSIRFIRMFLTGFSDSVICRFATLELGRNQWRNYQYALQTPGENLPQQNQATTDFAVTSVSVVQNSARQPINYVIPPGVNRQLQSVANGQTIAQDEQSLSLKTCSLNDGDSRAIYKQTSVDMRQFTYLRMFAHCESVQGSPVLKNGDLRAFIRIGSDFTSNYYEYQVPLAVTLPGAVDPNEVWPVVNNFNIVLQSLVNAKLERDKKGVPIYVPYQTTDTGNNVIIVVGNPNLGDVENIMLGVLNPAKANNPGDDGMPKCSEVWFDELRMAGEASNAGYAAAGKVALQLADLGNLNFAGLMHTPGYGSIDQNVEQLAQDNFTQYNVSSNLSLGKLMPRKWGVQLPVFIGYTQSVSTPKYNPYDQDVLLTDGLNSARDAAQRDSILKASQTFSSITSFNVSNVRILGANMPNAKVRPWSLKNFDLSYSYSSQLQHNPTIQYDNLTNQMLNLGYTYGIKSKPIEPFKHLIKSKSQWYSLIKDFNFTPLPSNFTFRSNLNRVVDETQVRNIDNGPYQTPTTFYKNFTWTRLYTLRWELTKSLSFDYTATDNAVIDEPYGLINTKQKIDSLWNRIKSFGRNQSYAQTFNATYRVPLQKLPVTDWINITGTYNASYNFTEASLVAYTLGNTIGNTQTATITGDFDFQRLYNKNRFLRAVNENPLNGKSKKSTGPLMPSSQLNRNIKDLRSNRGGSPKNGIPGVNNTGNDQNKSQSDTSQIDTSKLTIVNTANFTNAQLDSFRKVQIAAAKAKKKAEKLARKKARKEARRKRRASTPELSKPEILVGSILTSLKRININYQQVSGTTLPGWMDSTRVMGINTYTGAPGLNFVYGYQPNSAWLYQQAAANRLSRDSLFNSQFQQSFSRNISGTATLQPVQDLRIELNIQSTFTKSNAFTFKDTGTGIFNELNATGIGSFNITYISLATMFKQSGAGSGVYNQFISNGVVVSQRLGHSNPYTNGLPDPSTPSYQKGYTQYSQDVLIPSFIAAYTGKSAGSVPLIDYHNPDIQSNPFGYFFPMPNWRVTYNGLSKFAPFNTILNSLVINHAYSGTMSMNGFSTSLLYKDLYGLGFPSFIDSNSHNYVPFWQVPNVTISQQFNPLIGFDASFKNNLIASVQLRKSKTESLSLIDYQVSETNSTEYVIGGGYRIKNLKLPFKVFGVTRLKNELSVKVDIGLRNDQNTNNFLSQNLGITSSGQKVLRISPTVDYQVNNRLTLHFFYDRQQTIPYVSSAYPITTTQGGVTLRFIFAQ